MSNETRIDQALACEDSDYPSSTPWIPLPPLDWEPNFCGGCLATHEAASYKSRSPITRQAPPLEHFSDFLDRPVKPRDREEAPAGRGADVGAPAVQFHPDNRRRRCRRRLRGPPDPRHGEGESARGLDLLSRRFEFSNAIGV